MKTIHRRGLLAAAPLAAMATTGAARAGASKPKADLTGTWTNAWYTRLERPKAFKGLVATPAEVEAYEAPRRGHHGELIDPVHDPIGQGESEFPDNGPGLARIDGQIRSSWLVDPPDGRLPWRPEALAKLSEATGYSDEVHFDNVERRDIDERCLTIQGAAAPILNTHDGNILEIVQTPDWLVIVGEKAHATRIVRIARAGQAPAAEPVDPPRWGGVSVGRWDGATLVVTTERWRPGFAKLDDDLYLSDKARVTERFRRAPEGIRYDVAVDDPALFTRPWRAEMVFRKAEGRLFEYACHEGNYSLPGMLAAARTLEAKGDGRKGK
ncbi:MAG: hypothetical protein JSR98_20515 [Proteobacteria bacterium]|nr:hypothetical protein [Pseudomonadota bacterium]